MLHLFTLRIYLIKVLKLLSFIFKFDQSWKKPLLRKIFLYYINFIFVFRIREKYNMNMKELDEDLNNSFM